MYSLNPGNQFALGNNKYQVLEVINTETLKVTNTKNGKSHIMATEELYNSYEKGELFFFGSDEQEKLEEETIKKLLNPENESLSITETSKFKNNYLKRDPYTYNKEELDIVEFRLSFIDEITKNNPRALTAKHIQPIVDKVYEEQHAKAGTEKPSPHTVRKWYDKYIKSNKQSYSLLPRIKNKGNRDDRLNKIRKIIDDNIKEIYMTRNRNSISKVHDKIKKEIIRQKIDTSPPGYTAIYKRIKKMEKDFPYEIMRAREGIVAANEAFRGADATYQESRALECVEIDSTKLDLFVLYWNGKPAGRPWLTAIRDRYTQCITGLYLGFEPPSILSLSKALKNSFLKKDHILEQYPEIKNKYPCFGLPEIIVCDNAKEYWSKAFKLACRDLGIIVNYSPVKTPWIKGGVESFFKTLNEDLLHQQSGTTFSNIFERKDYDPEKNAVIHFEKLVEIIYTWIIDIYHQQTHKGEFDLQTVIPQKRWEETASVFPPMLPSKDSFDILFGHVFKRTLTKKGIEHQYIFYHSAELQKLRQRRGNIETIVKIDPDDISKVYVYDEVTEKYIIAHSLMPDYTKGLTKWQHKNNIRMAKILAGKVDEAALADADARIQQLIQECLDSDDSVAAKSKVSRHCGIDNDNPLGKPSEKIGNDDDSSPPETLSGVATGHETVVASEITQAKPKDNKQNNTKIGFAISDRLQEKANEQKNNT